MKNLGGSRTYLEAVVQLAGGFKRLQLQVDAAHESVAAKQAPATGKDAASATGAAASRRIMATWETIPPGALSRGETSQLG